MLFSIAQDLLDIIYAMYVCDEIAMYACKLFLSFSPACCTIAMHGKAGEPPAVGEAHSSDWVLARYHVSHRTLFDLQCAESTPVDRWDN